jgi:Zn-dependent M28 family amino/carboxypeptidase
VGHLVKDVGERHPERKWELADAADWIAGEFEGVGLAVQRLGAEPSGEEVALDVEATRPGGERRREVVILSAHYDSPPGSLGADDNATGVAALLALGRRVRFNNPSRTLRLVATARAESPAYAERLGARGETVFAVVNLSSLGYYSETPGSQRCPQGLPDPCSTTGNFVAVVGNDSSRSILDLVTRTLGKRPDVPVRGFVVGEGERHEFGAQPWSYAERGYASVTVTDTGPLRHPNYRGAGDTLEKVDFDQLTRLVAALEEVLLELGGRDDDVGPKDDYRPSVHQPRPPERAPG